MKKEDPRDRARAPRKGKRAYSPPKLTEYGSVAKLTQGGGSRTSDGGSTFKMTCL